MPVFTKLTNGLQVKHWTICEMDFLKMWLDSGDHSQVMGCLPFLDSWSLTSCHFKLLFMENSLPAIPQPQQRASLARQVCAQLEPCLAVGQTSFFWAQQRQISSGQLVQNGKLSVLKHFIPHQEFLPAEQGQAGLLASHYHLLIATKKAEVSLWGGHDTRVRSGCSLCI